MNITENRSQASYLHNIQNIKLYFEKKKIYERPSDFGKRFWSKDTSFVKNNSMICLKGHSMQVLLCFLLKLLPRVFLFYSIL